MLVYCQCYYVNGLNDYVVHGAQSLDCSKHVVLHANRQLNVSWNGRTLTHKPVYLGVTLARALSYKYHVIKTTANVGSRNILRTPNGEQTQGPYKVLLLPCATQQLNMSAQYGATLHVPKIWIQASTWPLKLLLVASNQHGCTTFICYVVLLHHRSEEHPSHK